MGSKNSARWPKEQGLKCGFQNKWVIILIIARWNRNFRGVIRPRVENMNITHRVSNISEILNVERNKSCDTIFNE